MASWCSAACCSSARRTACSTTCCWSSPSRSGRSTSSAASWSPTGCSACSRGASSAMSRNDVIDLLYIVAFSLFIVGLRMLRGPRTAVRGNQIAEVGMAIAVVATLLQPGVGDWVLIVVGVAIGTAVGVPAARSVKMTAMPQMVALFNGVGGGAVALIAVVEFRSESDIALETLIPLLFAAIIGSI